MKLVLWLGKLVTYSIAPYYIDVLALLAFIMWFLWGDGWKIGERLSFRSWKCIREAKDCKKNQTTHMNCSTEIILLADLVYMWKFIQNIIQSEVTKKNRDKKEWKRKLCKSNWTSPRGERLDRKKNTISIETVSVMKMKKHARGTKAFQRRQERKKKKKTTKRMSFYEYDSMYRQFHVKWKRTFGNYSMRYKKRDKINAKKQKLSISFKWLK